MVRHLFKSFIFVLSIIFLSACGGGGGGGDSTPVTAPTPAPTHTTTTNGTYSSNGTPAFILPTPKVSTVSSACIDFNFNMDM